MGTPVRLLDRVCIATTTGGTGSYALGAAPSGYLDPFVAGGASGDRVTYVVESEDRATWELCEGVITAGSPPTLSRARIIRNSSGGTSAVNWPSGTTKYITVVGVSDRLAVLNTDGALQQHRVADGANTWNLPGKTLSNVVVTPFSGTYDLGTANSTFVYATIAECSCVFVAITARVNYTAASSAASAILAVKFGADAARDVGQVVGSAGQPQGSISATAFAKYNSPQSNLLISGMARKDAALGPFNMLLYQMEIIAW
ncbi:hypothetical protein WDZ11_14855 [Roseomonas mucosa]|uniref:hypothetical protein n=1 Tax=Roseomonas mucosa TaxID=207340 RepID=UPI0030D1C0F2